MWSSCYVSKNCSLLHAKISNSFWRFLEKLDECISVWPPLPMERIFTQARIQNVVLNSYFYWITAFLNTWPGKFDGLFYLVVMKELRLTLQNFMECFCIVPSRTKSCEKNYGRILNLDAKEFSFLMNTTKGIGWLKIDLTSKVGCVFPGVLRTIVKTHPTLFQQCYNRQIVWTSRIFIWTILRLKRLRQLV